MGEHKITGSLLWSPSFDSVSFSILTDFVLARTHQQRRLFLVIFLFSLFRPPTPPPYMLITQRAQTLFFFILSARDILSSLAPLLGSVGGCGATHRGWSDIIVKGRPPFQTHASRSDAIKRTQVSEHARKGRECTFTQ